MSINAAAYVYDGLAARLRPRRPVPLSRWLTENLVLVDGPSAGQLWNAKGAPYLPEIADRLGEDDPCNLVTVRKSQQSGASILALGWLLFIADREPANALYAVPSLDALRDINSGKLQPLIDAWQKKTGREVIEPQTSRSSMGSTTYEKVFPGGRAWLGNANSVMALSSKTVKKGVKDELSKWQDIPGFGDPETLFFGRFTAFRRRADYKILEISTPEVDAGDPEAPGHCRIDRSFRASDQRFWHVPCPQCGELFVHEFRHLRIDDKAPAKTVYVCPANGCLIDDFSRPAMIRAGKWIARNPTGEHPGFHIDAFISLMMSYEAIAVDYLKACRKGEIGKKDFSNLVLGVPYQYKGDAPSHERLMERREEGLKRAHIPPRGLVLTAAADVQMRGIWFEVVAWAPNRESWTVEALYLDGSTDSPDGEAFAQLAKLLEKEWPDAYGRTRKVDALGVDSGYRAPVVYAWVRANQSLHADTGFDRVLALKGWEGWGRPAIGTPSLVDIDLSGAKVKKGAKVWPIGTWPLKGSFYADLAKLGLRSGKEADPDGYCHFGEWLDENYFKQLTAEYLADEPFRGRTRKVWKLSGSERDNHFLDCRVYNYALAEHLGLSILTDAEWAALAKSRGMPPEDALPLFKMPSSPVAEESGRKPDKGATAASAPELEDEDFATMLERLGKANSERWR